jgi:hypothetical protein
MYAERYIAFADILGFTDIVKMIAEDKSSRRHDALVKALVEAGTHHPGLNANDDIQFQTFSDSIVMSSASTITGLLHILVSMVDLSTHLLRNGLLIRGAITKGGLHHEQSVMFGPAFLEAYGIENKIAKYPRIILSREVHQDFKKIENGLKFPQVSLADDGPPFLHVFAKFGMLNEVEPTIEFLNSTEVLDAQSCQRAIQNLLDASIYEPSHYEKLRWLAIYWNGSVGLRDGRALEPILLPLAARF